MRTIAILCLLLSGAASADAQVRDSLLWVRAEIMFETADRPRVVWKAPANVAATRSIAFGAGRRFTGPIELRYQDSLYVGSGRVPDADEIRAVRVQLATGTLTIRAPRAGWEEGVAADAVFEPNDANAIRGEARVWTDMRPEAAALQFGLSKPLTGYLTMEKPD